MTSRPFPASSVVVLALLVAAVSACGDAPSVATPAAPTARAVSPSSSPSALFAALPGDGAVLHELPGTSRTGPDARVVVAAPAHGRVRRVFVAPGDVVAERAPIVELQAPTLADAAARLEGAKARVAALVARRDALVPLVADGLVRADVRLALDVDVADATAELHAARAVVRAAGLTDDDAPRLVDSGGRVTLRAPQAGTVTAVDVVEGAAVESAPLVEIAREASCRIEVATPRDALAGGGEPALVVDDATMVPLTPLGAAPVADGMLVRHWLAPTTPVVLPDGLPVRVVVLAPAGSGVLVPREAVVPDEQGGSMVLVRAAAASGADGAALVPVPVTVRARAGALVLVEGALEPGALVARDAIAALATGGSAP